MQPQFLEVFREFSLRSTSTRVLWWMTLGALLLLTACTTGSAPANTLVAPSPSALAANTASPATSETALPSNPAADWTTYHRDNTRSGYLPDMPDPQQLTVAWSTPLDGAV